MANQRICIADPDAEAAKGLETILQAKGVNSVIVADADALTAALSEGISCLIIDPTAEVLNAAALMPELPTTHKVPFVAYATEATRDDVVNAMRNGCLDWLQKPVDEAALVDAFARIERRTGMALLKPAPAVSEPPATSRILIREIARRIKEGNVDLPEVPQILRDMNALLVNLDVEADAVLTLIEKDPSLSARLVATANTAAYGGQNWESSIKDLKSTVTRLGNATIRNLVQTEVIKNMFSFRSPAFKAVFEKMWRAHFMSACLARDVAKALDREDAEEMYLLGLMHNIGELFLLRVFGEIFQKQSNQLLSMDEVLTMVRDYHTVFGEGLVRKWDLGDTFAFVTRHHHDLSAYADESPEKKDDRTRMYIVNLANQLALYAGCNYHKKAMPGPSLPESYEALEMPTEARETLRDRAHEIYAEVMQGVPA